MGKFKVLQFVVVNKKKILRGKLALHIRKRCITQSTPKIEQFNLTL